MKELRFEELSAHQKLGMAMVASITSQESFEYALELVKNHSLGAVWLNWQWDNQVEEKSKALHEAADYPLLFFTDAESGMGSSRIGSHNAIGCTNSEELAYAFGKVTAARARKLGINVVCDPVLDMSRTTGACGTVTRVLGGDKQRVSELAAAVARGLHDGGVLTVAKHYPGKGTTPHIDSHMAETTNDRTKEELLDYSLYPYKYLMERGLIDGVMTAHSRLPKIDDHYPASLSKKVTGILREMGFDGFLVTDALNMMGVVARFGEENVGGLAINGGNDLALVWGNSKVDYPRLCKFYDEGKMDEEMLDAAVKRVLAAQHKVLLLPTDTEITPEDEEKYERINTDSIYAKVDEGMPLGIAKEGKHFFAILTPQEYATSTDGQITVDTFGSDWYRPNEIRDSLMEKFPNSTCFFINEFPSRGQNQRILSAALGYDDIVFIASFPTAAYAGAEHLTPRIISLIDAMQVTNRISTMLYFGNPFVLEDLPHFSRVIIGTSSADCVQAGIRVLAGEYPAKGSLTHDVKLK